MKELTQDQIKERIAKRVAEELPHGGVVNLGVGIPTLAVDYLEAGKKVYIQAENGMLGVGPSPISEKDIIPNLINASRQAVTELPGSSYFDSATSFAMIRGGKVDATVIGALQISETGDLANWSIPGKDILGPGGAMDLVAGVKKVIVATQHTAKDGSPKIIPVCTMPLTALRAVDLIITEYGVFEFRNHELFLIDHSEDVSLEEIQKMTSARYQVALDLKIREVP